MKAAVNKAISKGSQKGATYVESSLRAALDKSISSQWSWIQKSRHHRYRQAEEFPEDCYLLCSDEVTFAVQYNTPYAAYYGGMMKPYSIQMLLTYLSLPVRGFRRCSKEAMDRPSLTCARLSTKVLGRPGRHSLGCRYPSPAFT